MVSANCIQRLTKCNKVAGDESGSLMNQLVERMLAVSSWLAPVDRPSLVGDLGAFERNVLPVALHRQLLQISRKPLEVLLVRKNPNGLSAEEIVVPKGDESHEHGQILIERSSAEMLVHLMKAIQHRAEVFRTDRQHRRKADRRIHRVASTYPVPEFEHVGGID